jgi:hypothetical protein
VSSETEALLLVICKRWRGGGGLLYVMVVGIAVDRKERKERKERKNKRMKSSDKSELGKENNTTKKNMIIPKKERGTGTKLGE